MGSSWDRNICNFIADKKEKMVNCWGREKRREYHLWNGIKMVFLSLFERHGFILSLSSWKLGIDF